MPTSDGGSIPVYRQIADDLRHAIVSDALEDGARLPGENDLMEQYGVARATARQALSQLINEGIATAVRGSGVYVRKFRPLRRHGQHRLSRELWGVGRAIWEADSDDRGYTLDQVSVATEAAPEYVARVLGLAADAPVCVRRRRYLVEDRPVQLATSFLPAELVGDSPITAADTGPGGIYARLAELGSEPAHFTEEIRSRMPAPEEMKALKLGPGTPVVVIVRTALTAAHRPVELNEMVLDSSAYVLQYDFDA
ncbi:GntR family transcriptional regulator [Allonocardiopsis opalescens]|uniref:GntR family transcriptional regulator n=1 Tax=Allonocardiopsis opalescens TaxID=1144618 RepID=A0A2T0PTZ9_9ACTN|nr:GntR family transcriptional regulator [Allonocardiopsis opalescens]PRX92377.1 GntR family transcriptional regulator [Allonocardiopsis opalescens]